MNTYNNIQWRETDFHKQAFQDATEFFDMLHIKSAIIPVVPLKHAELIPDAISPSTHIIIDTFIPPVTIFITITTFMIKG
jgi:hypothetical protein